MLFLKNIMNRRKSRFDRRQHRRCFNGCNLDGWEDKAILEQYLKKIDVSSEVYERFLSEAVDIGDIEDKYF